jgi:hypothetical protein
MCDIHVVQRAAASLTREVKKAVAVGNRDEIAGRMTPAQIAKA